MARRGPPQHLHTARVYNARLEELGQGEQARLPVVEGDLGPVAGCLEQVAEQNGGEDGQNRHDGCGQDCRRPARGLCSLHQ